MPAPSLPVDLDHREIYSGDISASVTGVRHGPRTVHAATTTPVQFEPEVLHATIDG